MMLDSGSTRSAALSDWVLTASVGLGLLWSPALVGIFVALALRRSPLAVEWRGYHWFYLASTLIGLAIVATRPIDDSASFVLQYLFIWTIPFVVLLYRPDAATVRLFSTMVLVIFAIDLSFNLFELFAGHDLLGRKLDDREGAVAARLGGVFAHSFYSGLISIGALTIFLSSGRRRLWAVLPLLNLVLAGSWRLVVSIPLLLLFAIWRQRSYFKEMLAVYALSVLAAGAVLLSSGVVDLGLMEVNPSNTFRVVAWVLAIDKIQDSPLSGVGYPHDLGDVGVSIANIDDTLTAESWYLGQSLSFGLPYMVLRLIALIAMFYRCRRYAFASLASPLILVDLVYGGFFESTLFYVLMWLQLTLPERMATLVSGRTGAGVDAAEPAAFRATGNAS